MTMLPMRPGKLYKVISAEGMWAIDEKYMGMSDQGVKLLQGKLFLFVEVLVVDNRIFSKILVDDKVLITYNGYLLRNHIREIKEYERLSSTSS